MAAAKLLGTVLHLHRGTPYVYQGEELGMTNVPFESIDDFRDIEALNHYAEVGDRGAARPAPHGPRQRAHADAVGRLEHAGFTTGEPWIAVNPNHTEINAEAAVADPGSVFHHYRRLIEFRHEEPAVAEGDFTMLLPDDERIYAFTRRLGDTELLVTANFSADTVTPDLPGGGPAPRSRSATPADGLDARPVGGARLPALADLAAGDPQQPDRHRHQEPQRHRGAELAPTVAGHRVLELRRGRRDVDPSRTVAQERDDGQEREADRQREVADDGGRGSRIAAPSARPSTSEMTSESTVWPKISRSAPSRRAGDRRAERGHREAGGHREQREHQAGQELGGDHARPVRDERERVHRGALRPLGGDQQDPDDRQQQRGRRDREREQLLERLVAASRRTRARAPRRRR